MWNGVALGLSKAAALIEQESPEAVLDLADVALARAAETPTNIESAVRASAKSAINPMEEFETLDEAWAYALTSLDQPLRLRRNLRGGSFFLAQR